MFFCEFCKIFKNIFSFDKIPPDDCFLSLSENFEKFFKTLLSQSTSRKLLFPCAGCRISTTRYSKKFFHRYFYTRPTSSHPKAFIYLKFLKTVCKKVYLPNLQLYGKNSFAHPPSCILSSFFFRMFQDYFFRRGFESVRAQFLSGNVSLVSGNKCYL